MLIVSLAMVSERLQVSKLLLVLLQLLGCSSILGTSLPLTADVDKGLDDFYPIVNGLPAGFVFGTASAAYQVSAARGATKIPKYTYFIRYGKKHTSR